MHCKNAQILETAEKLVETVRLGEDCPSTYAQNQHCADKSKKGAMSLIKNPLSWFSTESLTTNQNAYRLSSPSMTDREDRLHRA